jgi:hypothetical protein
LRASILLALEVAEFNPGITDSGLFWTIPTSENTISVSFAAGTAAFQASDLDVDDYHDVVNALMGARSSFLGHPLEPTYALLQH